MRRKQRREVKVEVLRGFKCGLFGAPAAKTYFWCAHSLSPPLARLISFPTVQSAQVEPSFIHEDYASNGAGSLFLLFLRGS